LSAAPEDGATAATVHPLRLAHLAVSQLRNLEQVEIEPSPRINVVCGNNGQGKTSLLEAIYLLATTKSFRTAKLAEAVRHDQSIASVRGTFEEQWPESRLERVQSVGLQGGRRTVRLDGAAPPSLAHYATRSPVVVFDPQQLTLSTGPAAERRTLLDRVTLFTHPELASHRTRYARAMRERQRLLADLQHGARVPELDAYETLMARHGVAITSARREASQVLAAEIASAFARIAAPDLQLATHYAPAGGEDEAAAKAQLEGDRPRDARSRRTGFGPHRDDLELTFGGYPARVVGSQGQHRALTLALKSAELACIAAARGLQPILLLDDVSSELDADRTAALFEFLSTTESQLFLTTTRRELITTASRDSERRDFELDGGVLTALP
jgi:DNA replication and repair protein RecF